MVEGQLRGRGIRDARVLAALGEIPRELFVGAVEREHAYSDGALPIAAGQTISQPWIVARMTELLELEGPERVLEVGTGSGYGAAVLSRCAAHVVSVERHAKLTTAAGVVLERLGYRNVELRVGDGALGVPDRAPFDAIVVTASADADPPRPLLEQLVPGGRLVCPVVRDDGEQLIRRTDDGEEKVVPVRFVPLIEDDG